MYIDMYSSVRLRVNTHSSVQEYASGQKRLCVFRYFNLSCRAGVSPANFAIYNNLPATTVLKAGSMVQDVCDRVKAYVTASEKGKKAAGR